MSVSPWQRSEQADQCVYLVATWLTESSSLTQLGSIPWSHAHSWWQQAGCQASPSVYKTTGQGARGLGDKNICRSHRVVGCRSSPTENARGANCQTVSRMCSVPVRDTGSSRTQAQRSAKMKHIQNPPPSASTRRQGLGAEAKPLPTQAKMPYVRFEPLLGGE